MREGGLNDLINVNNKFFQVNYAVTVLIIGEFDKNRE